MTQIYHLICFWIVYAAQWNPYRLRQFPPFSLVMSSLLGRFLPFSLWWKQLFLPLPAVGVFLIKKNWNQTVPIFQPVSKNKITHSFSASFSARVVAGIVLGHMPQMGKSLPMQQWDEDVGGGGGPCSAWNFSGHQILKGLWICSKIIVWVTKSSGLHAARKGFSLTRAFLWTARGHSDDHCWWNLDSAFNLMRPEIWRHLTVPETV